MKRLRQRIHYIWVRVGAALLVLMPLAMYLVFRPWNVPDEMLRSTQGMLVTNLDDAIVFAPFVHAESGLLLLPGCPVDPVAYVPLARRIAESGHVAVIVKIPYRCAPFGNLEVQLDHRLRTIASRWPDMQWVLAGHSRGGAHTARVAATNPNAYAAYVLMGTSHPRDQDLSKLRIEITKIVATNDGVAGEAQFDRSRLPDSTHWVRIEGGNHSQFAYYGFQLFDGRATISREAQQLEIVQALLSVLRRNQPQLAAHDR